MVDLEDVRDKCRRLDALESERAGLDKHIADLRKSIQALLSAIAERPRLKAVQGKRKRISPRQQAAVKHIQSNPSATYETLVTAVYGKDGPGDILNARSLIHQMKAAKKVAGEPGAWRVLQTNWEGGDAADGES